MSCPNCDIKLTEASKKTTFEDSEGNTMHAKVTFLWCIECLYEYGAY